METQCNQRLILTHSEEDFTKEKVFELDLKYRQGKDRCGKFRALRVFVKAVNTN